MQAVLNGLAVYKTINRLSVVHFDENNFLIKDTEDVIPIETYLVIYIDMTKENSLGYAIVTKE